MDKGCPGPQNARMEFIDLRAQQQKIGHLVRQNIEKVLSHGKYIAGPEVSELEQKIEEFLNKETCAVACGNGTDALQVACMALDLEPGAQVVTPALSFMATVEVPLLLGLEPVFVDVEAETGNLDPSKLEAAITSRTKLILPVSLYGQCANFREINRIAAAHGLPVLEDGAESFGASHWGSYSGSLTDVAATSFFPAKPLGCYGDGGMVFAKNAALAAKVRRICKHGQSSRYEHTEIGVNSRLDTVQAAVLLAKLTVLKEEHRKKQEIARRYCELLRGKVGLLEVEEGNESAHGYFPVLVENREALLCAFNVASIPYGLHFPCLHTQVAAQKLGYQKGDFPIAERIAREVVTIPMHAYLSDADVEQVTACILQNT